jgi:hypothetical protein
MHPHFHFTAGQILWTLTFAADLVLLIVLLGRDRIKRFPWFSLAIVLMSVRLLAGRLLFGRMANIPLSAIFIVLATLSAIAGFLVVVEMARRAFAPVKRTTWYACGLAILVISGGILAAWGPWPAWKTLSASSLLAVLQLLQVGSQKLDMLVDLLTVQLGLLVILFGRSCGAGWRTHTQRIVIGLSTASCAQLAVEIMLQTIARKAVPHSQAEYDHLVNLSNRIVNANGALYVAVIVWWIFCLWIDEPGGAAGDEPIPATPQPEYLSAEVEDSQESEPDTIPTPADRNAATEN